MSATDAKKTPGASPEYVPLDELFNPNSRGKRTDPPGDSEAPPGANTRGSVWHSWKRTSTDFDRGFLSGLILLGVIAFSLGSVMLVTSLFVTSRIESWCTSLGGFVVGERVYSCRPLNDLGRNTP